MHAIYSENRIDYSRHTTAVLGSEHGVPPVPRPPRVDDRTRTLTCPRVP